MLTGRRKGEGTTRAVMRVMRVTTPRVVMVMVMVMVVGADR